ncbi:MAG: metal ABC transporter ATP-binding protein [Planctomycetes bacterium]|nr:metal ABC transporter ATP-binding protein [Planctomycetota bacterium]
MGPVRLKPVSESTSAGCAVAIEIRGLTVSYGHRPVVRSVSVDIPSGRLTGVVGPNGAGKSTLLKAVLGLIVPESGSIRIFGKPVEAFRHRIAYVPQTEAVDWDFPVSVMDVVLMGRYGHLGWFGRPKLADREVAREALTMVSMQDYASRHIRQLSGGQQQRVFLARALCQQADILLLDEPFSGVDAATEQAIFDLMDRLTSEGKTLVVVNHDLSVLNRFDSILLLNQQVVAFGPTEEVVTDRNLRRTYGGRLTLLDRADAVLRDNRGDS